MSDKRLPTVRDEKDLFQRDTREILRRIWEALDTLNAHLAAGTTVSGATGGNAALKSLLTALASAGIIKDSTT